MDKLVLASGSPRRIEILERLGFDFTVRVQDVDESFSGLAPENEAVRIAVKKVEACIDEEGRGRWIMGADTFVVVGGELLVKPEDRNEAGRMIRKLSGRTHRVVTGIALNVPDSGESSIKTSICTTEVRFSTMTEEEIIWYLDSEEWRGVAAAYRIQEKGALFIESISGSYSNVMGLPINTFYGMLGSNNYNFRH